MTEHLRDGYVVSDDPRRLDLDAIHGFLSRCYWAEGIPFEVVARSVRHSLCFGLYHGQRQVGFARVVTDRATFAYLGDVFVLAAHRGRGLAKWLMECVRAHPDLQGLRRWHLATRDAHGLYAQLGFTPLGHPSWHMEVVDEDVYRRAAGVNGVSRAF